ncbi:efflux RND transporter permease subunit [Sediminicola luteus]|uniref:Cation transporter n=1 Tax=Sediminicola luteus TaxID=319238 RepID=A0A2A4G4B4_9FLAO|nr:efflux RND transporter permease subunit [Sediminicola luteus]PCE62592.1 cation transporter [Sediminicola luteus]
MIDSIVRFFAKNAWLTFLGLLGLAIYGFLASPFNTALDVPVTKVKIDAIPNLGDNQQVVYTEWKGRSPKDIEDQITYPLSSALLGMAGVKTIRTSSMYGFSNIYVIFEDNVGFYDSRERILEKLSTLPNGYFPEKVTPILGPDATALGQIFWYTLEGQGENGKPSPGWSLSELRSLQDFYVRNALQSVPGVSEVASVGGHVKEYLIEIDPQKIKRYNIGVDMIANSLRSGNQDIGSSVLEVNAMEYFVRGLGTVQHVQDINDIVVTLKNGVPILIKDIGQVVSAPAERRGILDKNGVEVVGGVVTCRVDANPKDVIDGLKKKLSEISLGLPQKTLADGSISKIEIVPFYDRSLLINDTIKTLNKALLLETLIAVLIIIVLLRDFKSSLMVSSMIPVSVFLVFLVMKFAKIEANIVALAGIAIAIGTIVDMGIIVSENIFRLGKLHPNLSPFQLVLKATNEVSGAVVTAGLTTTVSFLPIFGLTGAEGKMFVPLAFTKTTIIIASIVLSLFFIPPMTMLLLRLKGGLAQVKNVVDWIYLSIGIVAVLFSNSLGYLLVVIGLLGILRKAGRLAASRTKWIRRGVVLMYVVMLLTKYWNPLGVTYSFMGNLLFIVFLIFFVVFPILLFLKSYKKILEWVLDHRKTVVSVSVGLISLGVLCMKTMGQEFLPKWNEGQFLLMPTSPVHIGITENIATLKQMDMAVMSLPEIEYVVGKSGRAESALDPAPLSMYENLISYKPEYILDSVGNPMKFKVDEQGNFETIHGNMVMVASGIAKAELVPDPHGDYYRNWRKHIRNEQDIWDEIARVTKIPGVTGAPKLQPIETRLVMLQTGLRSNLGLKVKGPNLETIESFARQLERVIKQVKGVKSETVFAERTQAKPYLIFDIDRKMAAQFGVSVQEIQSTLTTLTGGKLVGETIEGRERYGIRIKFPRAYRDIPLDLTAVYVKGKNGVTVPLNHVVQMKVEKGPQSIKGEDGFLVTYVIFDKEPDLAEMEVVDRISKKIDEEVENGSISVSQGVSYQFAGSFEQHLKAEKTLSFLIPLSLLTIFGILFFRFRSIAITLMVFSGTLVAFAGGFMLLWLYGQGWYMDFEVGSLHMRSLFNVDTVHLSVAVWVGFIALFGIATDDGVVMATYLTDQYKIQKPKQVSELRNAVIQAGLKRIRPCLMTTATTLLALLPILTSTGKGSGILIPMALPAFGGMLLSLVSLFILPLLFFWYKEIELKKNQNHISDVNA